MNEELQQQLVKDLLIESFEGLDRFDSEMLALEKGEGNAETLNVIFRIIHTIKGTSGCIGLGKIESVAHVGENLLSLVRDGRLNLSPILIRVLLEYSDALKEILRHLEQTGQEGSRDYSALLNKMQALQEAGPSPEPETNLAYGLFEEEPASPPPPPPATSPPAEPGRAAPGLAAAPTEKEAVARTGSSIADTAIRVDVGQLDKLMNLVGELVLARNQIMQHSTQARETGLIAASQRLNLITTELQENVMKTRMQPIGNVWAKFPRVVHDLAQDLGKRVRLVMEGNETELDRTIIEAIKDPLTHIVRNAIDHGIEPPAERRAAGKPEEGMLILRAFHEGGQVNIEIMDDGRGIAVARVKEKAVQGGLVTSEMAARLSDREVFQLIFLPGFSTAQKVTNVSGRGVGMDVVKTNIEKIGGAVDISSEAGQGTTLKIKIPLTLAIIPALIVTSGGERFAIPQVSLVELVRLEGEQARQGIENVFSAPVYRLRGQLLPLVFLNQTLKIEDAPALGRDPSVPPPSASEVVNMVVVQADGKQLGLVVDAVNDSQEIVVKPLGRYFKGLPVYAGATILGDGEVALILDVMGLAQHAHAVSQAHDHPRLEEDKTAPRAALNRQTLLLFNFGTENRMAMPLASVGRLEKFPRRQIEREGRQEVVQYRGQIMPLLRLASVLGSHEFEAEGGEDLPVVVYSQEGRSVGLVVGQIVDIIEDTVSLQNPNRRAGVLGSAVIQGKVTEFVDVPALLRLVEPELAAH